MNKKWDDSAKACVKRMWAENYTSGEIGLQLGVTRGAVMGVLRRMGFLGFKRIRIVKKPVIVPDLRPKTGLVHHRKSRLPAEQQLSKEQLKAMFAQAVQNTAKLPIEGNT